jgi:hypothetical protein
MKQFSDLLDIDRNIAVELRLAPISDNGDPWVSVKIGSRILHQGHMSSATTLTGCADLCSPFDIRVELRDKIYHEHRETAVQILAVTVDGHDLVPRFTHLSHYHNERGQNSPTSYLGFNGCWNLCISRPFYQWLHQATGQGWLLDPDQDFFDAP